MKLNDFYILVDIEQKITIDKIQELPLNWSNISGLNGLSDEELSDLKWAGHPNIGWINIKSEKIKEYTSSPENLELNKNTLKGFISNKRKALQQIPISYNGAILKCSIEILNFLSSIQSKEKINYKCVNGYYTFTSEQIKDILNMMQNHIQKYFDVEMQIYKQIDSCQSISDFFDINYDF